MRYLVIISLLAVGCSNSSTSSDMAVDRTAMPDMSTGIDLGPPLDTLPSDMQCVNPILQIAQEQRSHLMACSGPDYQPPRYSSNPPVSGRHYLLWAKYQIYTAPIARAYWVHNLEHGGAVLLYRPDAPDSIKEALTRIYNALPRMGEGTPGASPSPLDVYCGGDPLVMHKRAILTPDPLLPPDILWAVTISGPEADSCYTDGMC